MAGTYACPNCERLRCYGGDPYPCSWCGFDGRIVKRPSAPSNLTTEDHDQATGHSTVVDSKGRKVFTAVHAPYVTDPADPFGFEEDARQAAAEEVA